MLLDYDGTLVPFAAEPRLAQPDAELLELLTALGSDPANEVTIVSGRPRRTLEELVWQAADFPDRRTWRLAAE